MRRLLRRRRALRAASTDAEAVLWYHLRDRRLGGIKFRRQHPFGSFIIDFFCRERRFAIELDGGQHFEPVAQRYDERRSRFLRGYGITVLRFSNDRVISETDSVVEAIARALGMEA